MELPKLGEYISPDPLFARFLSGAMQNALQVWHRDLPLEPSEEDGGNGHASGLNGQMGPMETRLSGRPEPDALVDAQMRQLLPRVLGQGERERELAKMKFTFLAADVPIMLRNTPRGGAENPAIGGAGCNHLYGGEHRKVDREAGLLPPILAGKNFTLLRNAAVRGPALFGDDVRISAFALVTRSVVCTGARIHEYAFMKDTYIGKGAVIGPRVSILNERLDGGEIVLRDFRLAATPSIKLHCREFGAVIGDGCIIGPHSIIEPGTFLAPGCVIPVNTHVKAGIYYPHFFQTGLPGPKPETENHSSHA